MPVTALSHMSLHLSVLLTNRILKLTTSVYHTACHAASAPKQKLLLSVCLQGMCSSPLPVGLAAYTASELAHVNSSSQSQASSQIQPHPHTSALNQAHSLTQSPSGSQKGGDSSQQRGGTVQTRRLRQLGVHANAGWDPCPELAGCGPLTPSWRQLADLFVPLLHRVSSCCCNVRMC